MRPTTIPCRWRRRRRPTTRHAGWPAARWRSPLLRWRRPYWYDVEHDSRCRDTGPGHLIVRRSVGRGGRCVGARDAHRDRSRRERRTDTGADQGQRDVQRGDANRVRRNGNLCSTGDPQVDGAIISVGVRPLGPSGTYTVNYRATSADGHVVSGSWSFRLTVTGTGTPGPSASAASPSSDGIPVWPFFVAAGLIVALGAVWAVRRQK
jgi:hypothetical protein